MKFNHRHKIRRELLGLSQKDIADKLKLSAVTISRYEIDLDGLSEFVVDGIKRFYDNLADELGLTDEEKRYLRIAENAVALMREDSPGLKVKSASSMIIDCGFVIQEITKPKFLPNDKKPKPYVMK